jgi:hypothetical protein
MDQELHGMLKDAETYRGVDRRRHRILVTRNTEYHFRDGLCVAVRDRNTGEWMTDHVALQRTVSGSLQFLPNGAIRPNIGQPRVGESLFFATGGRDLVTSPLLQEVRPPKSLVDGYPAGLRGLRGRAANR